MVASESSVLFVARDAHGTIVGSLTLALFRVPTGMRAWIEDVVVDESARGAGAGAALVTAALERAGAAGARTVDLTSRPSREAANRLYRRLGFEPRTTNVYSGPWNPRPATGTGGPGGPTRPPIRPIDSVRLRTSATGPFEGLA